MKIYTKTGDQGETGLFGGKRVSKASLRVECYGTIDELNSGIGILRTLPLPSDVNGVLDMVQHQLFVLGAELASPPGTVSPLTIRISKHHIDDLEKHIDHYDAQLSELKNFIIPGGHASAAGLHVIRCVSRRAERLVARLSNEETVNPDNLVYLNRLSDLFFVLARYLNHLHNMEDIKWKNISQ